MYALKLDSCVRGYNVYKHNWTARIVEVLPCARERGNRGDPYVMAMKRAVGLLATSHENLPFIMYFNQGILLIYGSLSLVHFAHVLQLINNFAISDFIPSLYR